uniref:Elicitin n=1 Tax=Albugo laibachii Nc14 TaxID=890382 RepID=F0VZR8_9STRA|nr:AlNc14C3G397 [Albugo laibachii Nc14]|eukprot:CCA14289.1 AlNc14C3G397 [Albugo laibachii Nc14]
MSKSYSKHVLLIAIIILHKVARTQIRCPFTQNLKLFMNLLKVDSSFNNCGDLSSYQIHSASALPNLDQLSLMCQSDECTAMIQELRGMNLPNCSAYLPWKLNRVNLLALTTQYDAVCVRIRGEDEKKIKAQAAVLILSQLSDLNMSTVVNSTTLVNATVLEALKPTTPLPKAKPMQQKKAPIETPNAEGQD